MKNQIANFLIICFGILAFWGCEKNDVDESYVTPFHGNYKPVVKDLINMTYGYSISQIEGAILGQITWNSWRDNIKNLYYSPNENYVDIIFSSY